MTLDIKRSGYDNLFLIGGYDWYAKFSSVNPSDIEARAKALCDAFDKLGKKDVVLVAEWENEVLQACGMESKPLPVVAKAVVKEQVKAAVIAPAVVKVETPKSE